MGPVKKFVEHFVKAPKALFYGFVRRIRGNVNYVNQDNENKNEKLSTKKEESLSLKGVKLSKIDKGLRRRLLRRDYTGNQEIKKAILALRKQIEATDELKNNQVALLTELQSISTKEEMESDDSSDEVEDPVNDAKESTPTPTLTCPPPPVAERPVVTEGSCGVRVCPRGNPASAQDAAQWDSTSFRDIAAAPCGSACSSGAFRGSHSLTKTAIFQNIKIQIISALQNNYMYLILDETSKQAVVVDPVDPDKVLLAVQKEGVNLTTVLTTHHHWDHAGGNENIAKKVAGLQVLGGDERVGALTKLVKHGDELNVGNLHIRCLATPCHTSGHMCYLIGAQGEQAPAVFTGDTLFIAGCGCFLEGTPNQMYHALIEVLGKLPGDTSVFCGHEYTVSNLRFAGYVEPDNEDIKRKLKWAKNMRGKLEPTVPSTIGEEKLINPFMRVHEPAIQKHAGTKEPIATMAVIRKEKDSFAA